MYPLTPAFLAVLALPAAIRAVPLYPRQTTLTKAEYIRNAMGANNVLNAKWFDASSGLWDGQWWQSANTLTTIADLADVNPDFLSEAEAIFDSVYTGSTATFSGWINDYYDDEGWWAMAWIKVYDVTQDTKYLDAAKDIFTDLLTGLGATCGGQWWDKQHHADNAINNELFIDVAASLGNRVSDNSDYYRQYAVDHANWFLNAGLQSENGTFHDGFDPVTCKTEGVVYSYNQGVIIGGLVELSKLTGNSSWLDSAASIAHATITTLIDSNGIFTETANFPTNDPTADMFKGVFARNLVYLQEARGDDSYVDMLTKNAISIWQNDWNSDGFLGPDWQGPVYNYTAQSQSSALDGLVAAAAVVS